VTHFEVAVLYQVNVTRATPTGLVAEAASVTCPEET
jgi:hypothetical protein